MRETQRREFDQTELDCELGDEEKTQKCSVLYGMLIPHDSNSMKR